MRRADLKIGLCQVGKLNSWALVCRWIRCPETQSELRESVVEGAFRTWSLAVELLRAAYRVR
jgi:hypothetical protein